MLRKELYERLLVCKLIQEEFKLNGENYTIYEIFQFMLDKGDTGTIDYIWLRIGGSHLTWDEHLEDICFEVLSIQAPQPRYSPFTISESTLESDTRYSEWYETRWSPYISGIVKKYKYLWEPRYKSKIQRGMYDIVAFLNDFSIKCDGLEVLENSVFWSPVDVITDPMSTTSEDPNCNLSDLSGTSVF